MPLSHDAVAHVAHLAHLGLHPTEIEELAGELSAVLDHIARLHEVDTSQVTATSHVVSLQNVMRDDEIRPSWSSVDVLANAPRQANGFFEVQAVFD